MAAEMPLKHGALVEPVAVAVHDERRADLQPGEKALVVGGGPIGLLIAAVARREGADLVVIEPDPYRRCLARQLGFAACSPGDPDTTAILQEWSGAAGAAVAFEVSGTAAGVATAIDALAVRGPLITRTEPLARAERAFLAWSPARASCRSSSTPRPSRGRPLRTDIPALLDLTGLLAVVTGARRGIGLAVANALAGAGADIVAVRAQMEAGGGEAARPAVST